MARASSRPWRTAALTARSLAPGASALARASEELRVVIADRVAAEAREERRVRHPDREAVQVAEHGRQIARGLHDPVVHAPRKHGHVLVRDLADEEVRQEVDSI